MIWTEHIENAPSNISRRHPIVGFVAELMCAMAVVTIATKVDSKVLFFWLRREYPCMSLSDWSLAIETNGYARSSPFCFSRRFMSKAQRPLPDNRDFIIVNHAMVSAGTVIQGTRSQYAAEIEWIQHTSPM
jgi:hypothetical protein